MHALSESGSFRSPSVLARHLSGSGSPRGRRSSELPYNYHNDTSDFESGGGGRDSLDIPIEEESEPSSPEPLHKVIPERLPRPKSASSTAGKLPSAAVAVNGGPDLPHHDPRRSSGDRHGTSETSSLLPKKAMGARPRSRKHYGATNTSSDVEDQRHGLRSRPAQFWHRVSHTAHEAVESCRRVANPKSWDSKAIVQTAVIEPVTSLPAVFLGLLLNVLDGLSYGGYLLPCGLAWQRLAIACRMSLLWGIGAFRMSKRKGNPI